MTRRRRTLIASPLEWQMTAAPVLPPPIPVLAERGGTQLRAPRAVVLVDTREQTPFDFSRFSGWFAGVENICVVERKDLADLVHSLTVDRPAFINRLRLMNSFPHRLLVISAALSQVKSPYAHSKINPNRILQSLIAVLAGLNIPFLCTETHELGEEVVASYLYQIHLYDWLETNDYGRLLVDA